MMNPDTKGIIVNATIDNQQRQFILFQDFPYSGTYHVLCDQEHVAEVVNLAGNWKVCPAIGRWLEGKNTDAILQAVLNVELPDRQ